MNTQIPISVDMDSHDGETGGQLDDTFSRFAPRNRLNALCPYYTMFPLSFPGKVLATARPEDWVLDPFCGRGTTLFAARIHGLSNVGVDVNPVAVALATAKLEYASPESVVELCKDLLHPGQPREVPEGDFWTLAYDKTTLFQVSLLRERLINVEDSSPARILRALVLGILHGPIRMSKPSYLSNQMPRTYSTKPGAAVRYWTKHNLTPPVVDVLDVVTRRAHYSLASVPRKVSGSVIAGDAKTAIQSLDRTFQWVVTSPPYYGMRTYVPDQWLRHWFLGGPPAVQYDVPGQLPHKGLECFTRGLADVWGVVSAKCTLGAKLVVRFGALPSQRQDPREIIQRSLEMSGAEWRIDAIAPAGQPPNWARQSSQFGDPGSYVEEVDCYATLVRI